MLSTCYTTQRTNIFREPLVRLLCPQDLEWQGRDSLSFLLIALVCSKSTVPANLDEYWNRLIAPGMGYQIQSY